MISGWLLQSVLFTFVTVLGQAGGFGSMLPFGPQQRQATAAHAEGATEGAPSAAAATTQPATQPTTQPTTQPVDAEAAAEAAAKAAEASKIDLLKVFKGEQKLTAEQLIEFGPWISAISSIMFAVLAFIPRLFVAGFLLCLFYLVYRTLRRMIVGSLRKASVDKSICDMLQSILKCGVMGFGLIVACNQLGIPIIAMLTGVSIIGLAVGFAAQETLANFIAGIVIFWDRPFQVGHSVSVDGTVGVVQRVTFRSTRLLTGDGDILVVPNTTMLSQKIVNSTTHPTQRVRVPIGISYKASVEQAREVLLGTLVGDERINAEPEPVVVVVGCGPSSVDLELRFWINDDTKSRGMLYESLERVKSALDAAGIEIPFPHMQVLVEDTPALAKLGGGDEEVRRAA